MRIREKTEHKIINPICEPGNVQEAVSAVVRPNEVRAIYPLIRSINSGRLTKNFTFYPAESLIGKNKPGNPTGYASFVLPYGKPILREHRQSDFFSQADVPLGRTVFAGFRRYREKTDSPRTAPAQSWIPGTVEGDGALYIVPAITDPDAVEKVLGNIYYTVSIGSNVDKVIESISGEDIAKLYREEKEPPPYERGQIYDGQLSYWKMGEIKGVECSFVNVPSDEYANVEKPDIGLEGIQLLVSEKKIGKESYSFYDAKTGELVLADIDEAAWDVSLFKDSVQVEKYWWLKGGKTQAEVTESASIEASTQTEEDNMALKEKIKLHIKNLDELVNLQRETENKDEFKTLLSEALNIDLDEALVSALLEGKDNIQASNTQLLQELQEKAITLQGIWNAEAIKLVLSAYEGDISLAQPEAEVPTEDVPEAVTPETVTEEEQTPKVLRGLEYGVTENDQKLAFSPFLIKLTEKEFMAPLTISSKEELDFWAANWELAKSRYHLVDEVKSNYDAFLAEALTLLNSREGNLSTKPINLPLTYLAEYYAQSERSIREYLLPLVAITRKLKVDQETLQEAVSAYEVFSNAVLLHFLANPPAQEAAQKTEDNPTESVSSNVVEMNSTPSTTEVPVDEKEDSTKPWYNEFASPRRKK